MSSRYIDSSSAVQDFRTRVYHQALLNDQLTSGLTFFDLLEVLDFLGGLTRSLESDSMEEVVGFCSIEERDGGDLSFDRLGIMSIPSQIVDV